MPERSNCRGLLKISNKNLNIERDKSQSNGYLLSLKKVFDTQWDENIYKVVKPVQNSKLPF